MGQVIEWRGKRSRHSTAKLTEDDVVLIRALLEEGLTPMQIAEKFEVTKHTIYRIQRKEIWDHVPDQQEINNE